MMRRVLFCVAVLAAVGFAMSGEVPADVERRRAAGAAMDDPVRFERAVSEGLKDADPLVRRYALNALYERDPQRALSVSTTMLTDASVAVRQVAKAMNRRSGLYRENMARSLDPLYDHDISTVRTVQVTDNRFVLDEALPPTQFVELRFGKPKSDLYVWLNGTYLGQLRRRQRGRA